VNPGGPAQGRGDSLGRMVELADGHLREAFSGLPVDEKVSLIEKTLQPGETVCGVARWRGLSKPRCSPDVGKRTRAA
jgi:hypothetical protein